MPVKVTVSEGASLGARSCAIAELEAHTVKTRMPAARVVAMRRPDVNVVNGCLIMASPIGLLCACWLCDSGVAGRLLVTEATVGRPRSAGALGGDRRLQPCAAPRT